MHPYFHMPEFPASSHDNAYLVKNKEAENPCFTEHTSSLCSG